MGNRQKISCFAVLGVVFALLAGMARADMVTVADCERDSAIDVWAAPDVEFCRKVMGEVFERAGVEPVRVEFDGDGMLVVTNAEVICSAFRTPKLLEDYDFPRQPLGKMHYALYATPDRADLMLSMKITDWPRMKVAYSPVSQGMNPDRESYFAHANLEPEYVEYRTSEGAVEALKAGEVDALFLYTPYGKRPEGLVEIVPIGMRNVYFAVRKDRPELMERLSAAYREWYIDNIERYDGWREELLGIRRPAKRVRIAAYSRGDLFRVSPDGVRSGLIEDWIRSLCAITHWTPDYVYGDYDQSVGDVMAGRLDLVGGLGFSPARGKALEFPHTPIGMLRVYLWARPGSTYQAGRPETWKGMKIGLLAGSLSAQRVKQRQEERNYSLELREFTSNRELMDAYFSGEVDGCVNIEMQELDQERALRLYASHPMYLVCAKGKPELFRDLEEALDVVCDDAPKYMRLISEKHYGTHSDMSELTFQESEWLERRAEEPDPIVIDFSPWPFPARDEKGRPMGLPKALLEELARHTGLKFEVAPQTGIQTAEAKFLRGDTDFWIPYPERPDAAAYGAVDVFSLPVPQNCSELYGAEDYRTEFMMFTHASTPNELTSILRKTMERIPAQQWQEMFMAAAAQRQAARTFFGLTDEQLKEYALWGGLGILLLVMTYAVVMISLLRRQARRAEEAAARAEESAQAKTRFLAMMSHELRTPLNAVIGFAEFLARKDVDEKRSAEFVQGILTSAKALLDLINDILDLSKLEVGAMRMRVGTCSVGPLMAELPSIFGHRAADNGVNLVVRRTGGMEVPEVVLSRQGFRQVLINLVGNSAKFTKDGSITVEYGWEPETPETGTLRLVVKDTGCGISSEKLERLFDPFVQDIATRMHGAESLTKGTGLGLPIVKRLVDAAGGTISVKSELDKGTEFSIVIPSLSVVNPVENTADVASPAVPEMTVKVPESVLVVDDILLNRKVLGIHLTKLGVKDVRFAENGVKALEEMKDWTPDLVLSDMWMPEMDGQQLSEAMAADARLSQVTLVAVTADVEVESTHSVEHFTKILAKPITSEKLRTLFAELGEGPVSGC